MIATGSVAELVGEVRHHGFQHTGVQWTGRMVVHVDGKLDPGGEFNRTIYACGAAHLYLSPASYSLKRELASLGTAKCEWLPGTAPCVSLVRVRYLPDPQGRRRKYFSEHPRCCHLPGATVL